MRGQPGRQGTHLGAQPRAPDRLVRRVQGTESHVLPYQDSQLVARPVELLPLVAAGSRDADHGGARVPQPREDRTNALGGCRHLVRVGTRPHRTAHEQRNAVDRQGQSAVLGIAGFGLHRAETHSGRVLRARGTHPHRVAGLPAHAVGPPQLGSGHREPQGDASVAVGVRRRDLLLAGHRGVGGVSYRRDLHAHAGCLASPQQVRHGAPHAHHPVTVLVHEGAHRERLRRQRACSRGCGGGVVARARLVPECDVGRADRTGARTAPRSDHGFGTPRCGGLIVRARRLREGGVECGDRTRTQPAPRTDHGTGSRPVDRAHERGAAPAHRAVGDQRREPAGARLPRYRDSAQRQQPESDVAPAGRQLHRDVPRQEGRVRGVDLLPGHEQAGHGGHAGRGEAVGTVRGGEAGAVLPHGVGRTRAQDLVHGMLPECVAQRAGHGARNSCRDALRQHRGPRGRVALPGRNLFAGQDVLPRRGGHPLGSIRLSGRVHAVQRPRGPGQDVLRGRHHSPMPTASRTLRIPVS